MTENACDKCGKPVPRDNDAGYLEALVDSSVNNGSMISLTFKSYRHLLPIDGCEGSPSRVKNIQTNKLWQQAYEKYKQQ